MVFDEGEPLIILGAPGGTQIAMGVLQVLLNMLDFKMPVVEAVSAPRFSATSNAIDITNRIPSYVVEPLVNDGYRSSAYPIRSALLPCTRLSKRLPAHEAAPILGTMALH